MLNTYILAAGEAVDTNPYILPYDINEAIWGSIATVIVVSLIVWKGGPAIKTAWNARIERIEGELAAAAATRAEGEAAQADVQDRIANVDVERERILADARETAATLQRQLAAKAEQEAEDLKVRATADIEASKTQVLADLQAEVAALALGAASEVVSRNLDAATQNDLIESYISNVGSSA